MASVSPLVLCVGLSAVAFIIGILVGHFGITRGPSPEERSRLAMLNHLTAERYSDDDIVTARILEDINPENIREHLRFLSKEPHIAGTRRDEELARFIRELWLKQGLDRSELVPYDVLLSYPTPKKPNKVQILSGTGKVMHSAASQENPVPQAEGIDMGPAYNGYSPSGDVTADPVYVNYGRVEDFDLLESLGINVSGKICIIRYGKIYRGNKVLNAEERGAVGVLLFLDPVEVALEGTGADSVYPSTWWMPGTAMQRGSIYIGSGDPLTPGYPSIDGAHRSDIKDANLPGIPTQPLGYSDAEVILSILGGPLAPVNWTGGLDITYHVGPGFNHDNPGRQLRLTVSNHYQRAKSFNTIGVIEGAIEPDRYVLIGNHRDTWGFGAIDASSGTSMLMELTRVLGEMRREGWRPRRTLVFCSWGAEEFGMIGSTEWVEEKLQKLTNGAVAYINVDVCVSGDAFIPEASPMMVSVLRQATQMMPDPEVGELSLYDTWKAYHNVNTSKEVKDPPVGTPSSGTDHAAFSFFAGIPAINIWWRHDKRKYPISMYPAYHTAYETFDLVQRFVDPKFSYHRGCAQLSGLLLHILGDSTVLPYDLWEFTTSLQRALNKFKESPIEEFLQQNQISLEDIQMAVSNFTTATERWRRRLLNLDLTNPLAVRQLNDNMMLLERVFIKQDGLPDRPDVRHMAFAPSKFDQYSSAGFPALSDLLHGIDDLEESVRQERWKKIRRHISDLMIAVRAASNFLEDSLV